MLDQVYLVLISGFVISQLWLVRDIKYLQDIIHRKGLLITKALIYNYFDKLNKMMK